MKRIFYGILLAAAIACFSGCNIAGGDMPESSSEKFLQERNEPETLIQALQKRETLPAEEYQRLAAYSNRFVDRMLGMNPACPEALLKKFAGDSDYYVRRGVAENPNAPYDLLKKLSLDSNRNVRMSLAANPSIPVEMMKEFANSKDSSEHFGLARNPAVPPDLLRDFYNRSKKDAGTYYYLASEFAMNRKLPEDIANDIYLQEKDKVDSAALYWLALNPSCPKEIEQKIRANHSRFR